MCINLFDVQAVSHIPRPCVPRLDPNDPNMVVGIPEEPLPVMDITQKESKKVHRERGRERERERIAVFIIMLGFQEV